MAKSDQLEPPILGFFGEYRWLSNFALVTIEHDGFYYPSTEHAYVAAKTLDMKAKYEITKLKTCGEAKRFGRTLELRPDWEEVKEPFMRLFTHQKYSFPEYAKLLKNTKLRYLEETNTWGDTYWGVCNGIGLNRLGIIIMDERDTL